jgi:hypothetical protein
MWIRFGFNADPDPGIQTNHADPVPDPEQSFKAKMLNFYMKNIL